MSKIYLHETISFRPGTLERYVAELTRTWKRVEELDGVRNVGVWRTLGTSGAWHELVLLWEVEDWHHWARLHAGPNPPHAGVVDWLDRDWGWRTGGYGRIMEPSAYTPDLETLLTHGPRGAVYIHEIIQVVPGKKAEYLARFERDWLPVTRKAGRELVGAYTILESNLQVLVILAMPDLETHARGMGARLSDEDRARWSAGASEIRTDWVLRLLVPAGVGGITG
jgi:hypothetical protein